tara:strand:- start:442 stop:594 length:153 start_codon:yes stop_codon:yes gene_type:complete
MSKNKEKKSEKISNEDRLKNLIEQKNQLEIALIKITGAIELLNSMEKDED